MDSEQPVDDVGQLVRRNRLHAAHFLEAQELRKYTFDPTISPFGVLTVYPAYEPRLPHSLHCT